MPRAYSKMVTLGSALPAFSPPDTVSGKTVSGADYAGRPVLIMFISNHCPYVVHLADALAAFGKEYQAKGLSVVAICSNDIENFPQDAPDKMKAFAAQRGFTFPYLYDETQQTAQNYQAMCTPDFFLFDEAGLLVYRGQFDETRPNKGSPTGADMRAAADAVLAGRAPSATQAPSWGCNIKWKEGAEPEWA